MPTNDELPNLYRLPFEQQRALFSAQHVAIVNERATGVSPGTVDELREAGLIDEKGSLTPSGRDMLKSSPEVGMGVTEILANDKHAWTVITVLSRTRVQVQQDRARRTDKNGRSESQTWEHTPNPDGETKVISLRQDGSWTEPGKRLAGSRFRVGERETYKSPSF